MNNLTLRSEIVVPGEKLGSNIKKGSFTYRSLDDGVVRASIFGLKDYKNGVVSVIPLAGKYMPKEGDMVIGIVTDVTRNGWTININAPYDTYLNHDRRRNDEIFDLRRLYKEGDILSVKITKVNEIKQSYAEGPRKLQKGRIILVSAKKIPRIIGSKKSMLTLLREKSGCRITVGQNGIIWLDGPEKNMQLVVDAILKIERESHTKGLTDRISEFLDEEMRKIKKV